jgi:hypothetical protein
MRSIRTATINHSGPDHDGERVTLRLRRDGTRYVWLGDAEEHDTGVDGASIAEACDAARHAWSGSGWDLRARWL